MLRKSPAWEHFCSGLERSFRTYLKLWGAPWHTTIKWWKSYMLDGSTRNYCIHQDFCATDAVVALVSHKKKSPERTKSIWSSLTRPHIICLVKRIRWNDHIHDFGGGVLFTLVLAEFRSGRSLRCCWPAGSGWLDESRLQKISSTRLTNRLWNSIVSHSAKDLRHGGIWCVHRI